jgi:antitoxin component YwqK of YwqJK toxin-antitoxin module
MKKISTFGLGSFTILLILGVMGFPLWVYFFGDGSLPSMKYLFFSFIFFGVILLLIISNLNQIVGFYNSISEGDMKSLPSEEKIKDGPFEEFYPNGNLKLEGNYSKGKKEGVWKEYFENGVLKETGNYRDGKKDGVFKSHNTDDEKNKVLTYSNGRLIERKFIDVKNVNRKQIFLFEGQKIESLYVMGSKIFREKYLNGNHQNGFLELFHSNGQVLLKGHYEWNSLVGLWEQNDETGQFLEKIYSKDGGLNYTVELYSITGQLIGKRYYLNGKREGLWESFYENGQIESKLNFINDEGEGLVEYYYENGQLAEKGNYLNGNHHGLWESYYENGQLESKGNYLGDGEIGTWEYYDINGEKREMFFEEG